MDLREAIEGYALARVGQGETDEGPMTTTKSAPKHATRETWLQALTDLLRPTFADAGFALPETVHVSCGWPVKGGLGRTTRVEGECWLPEASTDGNSHIFVSPLLGEDQVGHVLVHELCHAATPGAKHRGRFVTCATKLGLEGKPTSTVAGAALAARLEQLVAELGAYPHARLDPKATEGKKQGTRQRKLVCACPEPRILRATRKVIEAGPVICGLCETTFVADVPEDDAGEGE